MDAIIILVLILAFFALIFYSIFSKKGRGKVLGGDISWSGKAHILQEKKRFSGHKEVFQVHAVKTRFLSEGNKVGLELRSSSYMHVGVIPISLSIEQALEVAEEINNAVLTNHT